MEHRLTVTKPDGYQNQPSKEETFSLFRLQKNGFPGIRMVSKPPTVLRLCLVEQNRSLEALLVGATVSAAWVSNAYLSPREPWACLSCHGPCFKVRVSTCSADFCLPGTKIFKKGERRNNLSQLTVSEDSFPASWPMYLACHQSDGKCDGDGSCCTRYTVKQHTGKDQGQ